MTDREFNIITGNILAMIRARTPRDTGNLRMNATKSEPLSNSAFRIYINTEGDHLPSSQDGIAPYFVFVNYAPTLRGKPNRNYGYWERAIDECARWVATTLGGALHV